MNEVPISYPGRYAPGVALNYADHSGAAVQVSSASPLPVSFASAGDASAPPSALEGTATEAIVAGPYAPELGKSLVLTLDGTWTGTVQLLRSVDGGASKMPVTMAGAPWATFSANACEPVWEESEAAAEFYLDLAPLSGTIAYRLAQ